MIKYNKTLKIYYNTETNRIELEPSRLLFLLCTYRKRPEDVREKILKEIREFTSNK